MDGYSLYMDVYDDNDDLNQTFQEHRPGIRLGAFRIL